MALKINYLSAFFLFFFYSSTAFAQAQTAPQYMNNDSLTLLPERKSPSQFVEIKNSRLNLKLPATLIVYGFANLAIKPLREVDEEIKEELWTEHPHKLRHVDTYLQFVPAVAVFGLDALGVKGRHNVKEQSTILLMTEVINSGLIYPLKKITHQIRPDNSNNNSFPSGHTAQAFASAEFLRMEYKDVSPWYGIAGYTVAAATGYLRMYNNKHWFSDVAAGAGVGILSTRLAYFIYGKINHKVSGKNYSSNIIAPYYQDHVGGIHFLHRF